MKMRRTKIKMRKQENEKAGRQTLIPEPEPEILIPEPKIFTIPEPELSNTRKTRPEPENLDPSPKCLTRIVWVLVRGGRW